MSESKAAPPPEWDLSDLYPAIDAPALKADFDAAERDIKAFAERYQGRVAALSGDALAEAIT
jgi:oligoendopeptidase F